jgi:hypothetical protein
VTCFDTYQARIQSRKEFQHLRSAQLSLYHWPPATIDAMNLEHVLRNIKTDGERRHLKSPEVAPEVCAPEGARVHTISLFAASYAAGPDEIR